MFDIKLCHGQACLHVQPLLEASLDAISCHWLTATAIAAVGPYSRHTITPANQSGSEAHS